MKNLFGCLFAISLLAISAFAQSQPLTLSCCTCLGGNPTTYDLSTGAGWRYNGGAAQVTTPSTAWTAATGAAWLQPYASSSAVSTIPQGDYLFTIQFTVPKCTIPMM